MTFPSRIDGSPDFSMLTISIPANQTLRVEASSMAAMDSHLSMKTKMRRGFARFLSGESLFLNEFTAHGAAGEISIAPGPPGDISHVSLDGREKFYLTNGAFLASTTDININSKWQGLSKGFFSGKSFFLMECSGSGDIWFNCYGAMMAIDVDGDYIVDTGHLLAFSHGLSYDIKTLGGYKSLFFSGEGFVARFHGKGKVWVQTKVPAGFANWAQFYRPVQRTND
jgi:uncharacterized protein (TIGR00266 family)